jgi:phage FluMu protein Com
MANQITKGDTVRIINPLNQYFHMNEEMYVKDVRLDQIVVHKVGVDFILSSVSYIQVEKLWQSIRCPFCKSLLFETCEENYIPFSVRMKCRMCKEMNIVRGRTDIRDIGRESYASNN